jgi:hypothetical protein
MAVGLHRAAGTCVEPGAAGGASAEGGEGEEDRAAEQDRGRDRCGEAPKRLKAALVGSGGIGPVGVHGERLTVTT